jgi:hypothetical protein
MKKVLDSCLMFLVMFFLFGCQLTQDEKKVNTGTLAGAMGVDEDDYYVLNQDGDENAPFYFYLDENSKVFDVFQRLIKDDIYKEILASKDRYSLKIKWDESLTKVIPSVFGQGGGVAYYASYVEQYLVVPEGYAVCSLHNDFINIKKPYEIGKPWEVQVRDFVQSDLQVYSFHVTAMYLNPEKIIRATEDTFKSFPEEGISLFLERAEILVGNYLSADGGSLLKVGFDTFTFVNGDEEITCRFKSQYYKGRYHVIVNENDEVTATFFYSFTNLENYICIRNESDNKEVTYYKQP